MSPAGSMPTRTLDAQDQPQAPAGAPEIEGVHEESRVPSGAGPAADQHPGKPSQPGVPLAPPGIPPESDVRVHAPSSAQPQPSHGISTENLGELPMGYGDGRLVALVRDPETLYLYWDFAQQQVEQAFIGLGAARAVVKLWNVRSPGEALVRESEIHLGTRGWYLRELPPGTELRVEVWAVGEKGARLLRAARPVRLPPVAPSDQLEAFYLRVPLDLSLRDGLHRRNPLQYGGAAPAEWDRRIHPRVMLDSSPSRFPPGTANQQPGSAPGPQPWASSPGGGLPWASSPGGVLPWASSPGGHLPWSAIHVPDLDKNS
jgi:hypothetical protein